MIPLQLATRWNVYGVAPNRRYIQANKNEGIHEIMHNTQAVCGSKIMDSIMVA